MNAASFVSLSATVCKDLREWIEEARRQALLSEGQLLTLSDAADVIDRATSAVAAHGPAVADDSLVEHAAEAADEAGSAFLPHDKVMPDHKVR